MRKYVFFRFSGIIFYFLQNHLFFCTKNGLFSDTGENRESLCKRNDHKTYQDQTEPDNLCGRALFVQEDYPGNKPDRQTQLTESLNITYVGNVLHSNEDQRIRHGTDHSGNDGIYDQFSPEFFHRFMFLRSFKSYLYYTFYFNEMQF